MKKSNFVAFSFCLLLLLWASNAMGQRTSLISFNSAGTGSANNASGSNYATSPDGRFIAFASAASDLGPTDTNNLEDIYLRDTLTGATSLVSANYAGTNGGNNGSTTAISVSADGRYVLFSSNANDLVTNDTNGGLQDIFLRDVQTATTTLISVNAAGTGSGNNNSLGAALSSNQRYVMFMSFASNMVANDNNGASDVFMRDLQTGTTTAVSVNSAGTATGDATSQDARMTPDGRYVVFTSLSTNLVNNDTNGLTNDIFVRDMVTGTTTLVSVNQSGTVTGNAASTEPSISADGRFVCFRSSASDLASNDNNGALPDIFVRDRTTNVTSLVSVNWTGTIGTSGATSDPAISSNGRFVVFTSTSNDLVSGDNNTFQDIFVRDRLAGTTSLVTISPTGQSGNGFSSFPVLSADGRYVAFRSQAKNLTALTLQTANNHVFVRDLYTGVTDFATANSAGTSGGNGGSGLPRISANGGIVLFSSFASDLVANDMNARGDVFAFHTARPGSDFDGDGKNDSAVWNPTSGMWSALSSFDGTNRTQNWGTSSLGDVPVPGDYDGDGKVDAAVFRPGEGMWYILQSSPSSVLALQWGTSADRPVPADYDGDARTDIAVFRPSEGVWHILQSRTGSPRSQAFGLSDDRLVPADYDADGKADLAVFRPSVGTWYIFNSSDGSFISRPWGESTDRAVPADYDGDGKADLAVFRPGDRSWYVLNSSDNSSRAQQFGLATDVPVPGDYDGDGKADLAVFRQGTWYVWQSSNQSLRTQQLGGSGDVTVTSSPF